MKTQSDKELSSGVGKNFLFPKGWMCQGWVMLESGVRALSRSPIWSTGTQVLVLPHAAAQAY